MAHIGGGRGHGSGLGKVAAGSLAMGAAEGGAVQGSSQRRGRAAPGSGRSSWEEDEQATMTVGASGEAVAGRGIGGVRQWRRPGRGSDPVGEVEVEDGAPGHRVTPVTARGDGAPQAAIGVEGEALDPEGIGQRRGKGIGGWGGLCGRGRVAAPGGERGERWVEC